MQDKREQETLENKAQDTTVSNTDIEQIASASAMQADIEQRITPTKTEVLRATTNIVVTALTEKPNHDYEHSDLERKRLHEEATVHHVQTVNQHCDKAGSTLTKEITDIFIAQYKADQIAHDSSRSRPERQTARETVQNLEPQIARAFKERKEQLLQEVENKQANGEEITNEAIETTHTELTYAEAGYAIHTILGPVRAATNPDNVFPDNVSNGFHVDTDIHPNTDRQNRTPRKTAQEESEPQENTASKTAVSRKKVTNSDNPIYKLTNYLGSFFSYSNNTREETTSSSNIWPSSSSLHNETTGATREEKSDSSEHDNDTENTASTRSQTPTAETNASDEQEESATSTSDGHEGPNDANDIAEQNNLDRFLEFGF